ncbi:hypothetical protein AEST_33100 [Alishewanella aestuarii B11]|uniref:Uncharacterized protein n=1 Tax=Alishewanella aestuarii B11 TaxID=1197174 RepID=J1PYI5_9ALTE|nr:hypothetical protein AEST_33100 [Alishewanella aestuarii B11]
MHLLSIKLQKMPLQSDFFANYNSRHPDGIDRCYSQGAFKC